MNEVIENRVVKRTTGSGAMTIVAASLVASLSAPVASYAFEDESSPLVSNYYGKNLNISDFDVNVERIVQYSAENYTESIDSKGESYAKIDLKFLELSQQLAENQVEIDSEIQGALNEFSRIIGAKKPQKNRF